jgi:hypothetical protein
VSLFDISDFANPTLADRLLLTSDDWSWSESLYDHHAFTFYNGVLSLPVYTYDYTDDGYDAFSGLWVIDVDTETGTLGEMGRVGHKELADNSECPWTDDGMPCQDDWYWYADMRRSVVIEDALFSISNYGIKVTEHADPEVEMSQVLWHPYTGD